MNTQTRFKVLAVLSFVTFTSNSWAVPIGIVDSGTDMKHPDLAGKVWVNPGGLPGDNFTDDTHGWNFAENNNQVIDYKYVGTFSPDVKKYFEIQLRVIEGTASAEDKKWIEEKRKDQKFIQELMKFGNFVHGTHVSGIASKSAPEARIMAAKIIPTEVKAPGGLEGLADNPMDDMKMSFMLGMLADRQAQMLTEVGKYLAVTKMKVANCSFGTSEVQAKTVVAAVGKMILGRELSAAEVEKYSKSFMGLILDKGSAFTKASEGTLFVMAAGNDGSDNDQKAVYPANLKFENTISVAATRGYDHLASFSNYGASKVEIAAPGVGILSAIPGNEHLLLSGTSQAAPFVAHIAGKVMDANSALSLKDVKAVLLQTVDKKAFLEGKVTSGGIANEERAVQAAVLSKEMPLDQAIQQARLKVADVKTAQVGTQLKADGDPIPLPSLFSLPVGL